MTAPHADSAVLCSPHVPGDQPWSFQINMKGCDGGRGQKWTNEGSWGMVADEGHEGLQLSHYLQQQTFIASSTVQIKNTLRVIGYNRDANGHFTNEDILACPYNFIELLVLGFNVKIVYMLSKCVWTHWSEEVLLLTPCFLLVQHDGLRLLPLTSLNSCLDMHRKSIFVRTLIDILPFLPLILTSSSQLNTKF